MPNDVPDWTRVNQEQIVGRAPNFTPLGDVTSPSLVPDSVVETFSGGNLVDHAGVVCSFKPAAGQAIALRGVRGAFTIGGNLTVTPPFGQATVAGNLLVARVTAGTSAINSASPGWVQMFNAGTNDNASVWYKSNCGNAETAPTFTCVGATRPMMAQVAEYTGAPTASPNDNSGGYQSPPIADPMSFKTGAADAVTGDLMVVATVWRTSAPGTATFSDSYGNQATPTVAGTSGASSLIAHSNFTEAIIPALVGAQPLGVAPWIYDVTGFSAPATGSQATVTLAAVPGKRYVAAKLSAVVIATTAVTTGAREFQLLDGASEIFRTSRDAPAVAGNAAAYDENQLGFGGTIGNSMTWKIDSGVANISERVAIGAYLR